MKGRDVFEKIIIKLADKFYTRVMEITKDHSLAEHYKKERDDLKVNNKSLLSQLEQYTTWNKIKADLIEQIDCLEDINDVKKAILKYYE